MFWQARKKSRFVGVRFGHWFISLGSLVQPMSIPHDPHFKRASSIGVPKYGRANCKLSSTADVILAARSQKNR